MNKFLKLIALAVIFCLVLSLSACGNQTTSGEFEESDVENVEQEKNPSASEEEEEEVSQPDEDDPVNDEKEENDKTPSSEDNKKPQTEQKPGTDKEDPDTPVSNTPPSNEDGGVQPDNGGGAEENENQNQNQNQNTPENNTPDSETPDFEGEEGEEGNGMEEGAVGNGENIVTQPIIKIDPIAKPAGYEDYMTVVSYNIKCAMYSKTFNQVTAQLKAVNADIVGLQECDVDTTRSGKGNQVQMLAKACGYRYWYFAKTLDHQGGQYGHGILSKYPITNSQVVFFKYQSGEKRNVERHEIEVNGKTVAFYNTHLCGHPQQYYEAQKMMLEDKYAILVGDLNFDCKKIRGYLDQEKFIALNGGDSLKTPITTCGKKSAIDNIIVSKNTMDYYFDTKSDTGIFVYASEGSDHNMIYSYIKLK